jgi:hypothetical protein
MYHPRLFASAFQCQSENLGQCAVSNMLQHDAHNLFSLLKETKMEFQDIHGENSNDIIHVEQPVPNLPEK